MKVSAKFSMNHAVVKKIEQGEVKALEMTANAILTDTIQRQVVPRKSGDLQKSGDIDTSKSHSGTVSVFFDTPYARRNYYHPEYNFRKTENPNAQAHWMDCYLPGGEKQGFAENKFAALFKQFGGV